MDVVFISGLSEEAGMLSADTYTNRKKFTLTVDGKDMNILNLKAYFKDKKRFASLPDKTNVVQPKYLNGICIYDYLTKRGLEVGLINCLDLEIDKFKDMLRKGPLAIAISTTFIVYTEILGQVVSLIRDLDRDITIIVGGPQVFHSYIFQQRKNDPYYRDMPMAKEMFYFCDAESDPPVDVFVVEKRGEKTLFNLIQRLKQKKSIYEEKNIAYYTRKKELLFTQREEEITDLGADPISWDKLDEELMGTIVPLQGSVGCPYKCKFCSFNKVHTVKRKPLSIIKRELDMIQKRSFVKAIEFTDDNLFISPNRMTEFAQMYVDGGYHFGWHSFLRANSIQPENIALLKESNCRTARMGFESGDETVLRNMNKKGTPDSYLQAMCLLNDAGIDASTYFIVGFPGETPTSIENTINLMNRFPTAGAGINFYLMFSFLLVPFSEIWEPSERATYGLEGFFADWKHDTMHSGEVDAHIEEIFVRVNNSHASLYISDRDYYLHGWNKQKVKTIFAQRDAIVKSRLDSKELSNPLQEKPLWAELENTVSQI